MAAFDYVEMAEIVEELINETGRSITLYKISGTAADATKPWRGTGTPGPTKTDGVVTKGVFVIPATSIPTESRGLAFDWVDQALLRRTKHVCLTPARGLAVLDTHKIITDSSVDWKIIWGQCLQPGATRLLYIFGVEE